MYDPEQILGYTVDDEEGDYDTQEEVNEINLYLYDQECFLKLLNYRVSRYALEEYLDQFSDEDSAVWDRAFYIMIKNYSLNTLKTYQTEIKISNFEKHVKDLVRDIKIKLQDDITENKININFNIEELDKYLKDNDYHLFIRWSIRFLDIFSYKRFMKKIFEENMSVLHNSEDIRSE
jgi:hypothetical protein